MGTMLFSSLGFDVPRIWRHDAVDDNLLAPDSGLSIHDIATSELQARYGERHTQTAAQLLLRLFAVAPGFDALPQRLDFAKEALTSMLASATLSSLTPASVFNEVPVFARLEDAVVWFSDQINLNDPTRLLIGLTHFIQRVALAPHVDNLRRYHSDPELRDTGYVHQALNIFLGAPARDVDRNVTLSRMVCSAYFNPRLESHHPECFYCVLQGATPNTPVKKPIRHRRSDMSSTYRNWWQAVQNQ